jgi:ABC-2 type transport system ATP-binding protein
MDDIVLKTRHLNKRFGSPWKNRDRAVVAVEEVNLEVHRGEIFGFLGPNGAGKTTTIGILLGLIHPDDGDVFIFDEPVTPGRGRSLQRVGALVGPPALFPYLSAYRNLEILARLESCIPAGAIERVLEQTGLSDADYRPAGQFSSGMKQRLGLAMALLHNPELLILDEPTNGMDPAGMHEMRDLLRSLKDQGVTIFLSSHLLHEVEQVCDRVAVLNHGKMIATGTIDSLLGEQQVIQLRVDSAVQVAKLLENLPGARDIQSNGTLVTLKYPSSQAVNEFLARQNIFAEEITVLRADLEELFLELTQDK